MCSSDLSGSSLFFGLLLFANSQSLAIIFALSKKDNLQNSAVGAVAMIFPLNPRFISKGIKPTWSKMSMSDH